METVDTVDLLIPMCDRCLMAFESIWQNAWQGGYETLLCRTCRDDLSAFLRTTEEFKEFEKLDQRIRAIKLSGQSNTDCLELIQSYDAYEHQLYDIVKIFVDNGIDVG